MSTHDLIVIGAGPAGSAAAVSYLRARPEGRVLLLDRSPRGRDKVCGDALGPDGVAEIVNLGLLDVVRPSERVEQFRLTSPRGNAVAGSPPVAGYVIPRTELDARLLQGAVDAGAEFTHHRVRTVTPGPNAVTVDEWSAPWVVAADGANSVARQQLSIPSSAGRHMAVAVRGYAPTPEGFNELYIGWDQQPGGGLCYVWAFPTDHGLTNVGYGLAASADACGRAQLITRLTELLPQFDLRGVKFTGHRLPLSTQRPQPDQGRVLLTGDAANLVNPLSGEGIFYALASGAMAGRSVADNPERAGRTYRRALEFRFGRHHRQMRLLYPLLDVPFVVEAAVRACGRDPRVFARMIDIAVGERHLELGDVVRFARAARLR